MAAITRAKATMAKSALTSFMSYGALNKGFWSAIVIKYINGINHFSLMLVRCIKLLFSLRMDNKKATESGFFING